jgi:hypothetical protein
VLLLNCAASTVMTPSAFGLLTFLFANASSLLAVRPWCSCVYIIVLNAP